METIRVCRKCQVPKNLSEFGILNTRTAIDGRNPFCKACNRLNDRKPGNRYSAAKAQTRAYGRVWSESLTFEIWMQLIQRPCFYCDGKLSDTGRGLDRKDNNGPYSPENCVPCCAICNQVKAADFTTEEMLRLGAVVRQIRTERAARGQVLEHWQNVRTRTKTKGRRRALKAAATVQ